jgi:hypothetical protein
MGREIMAALKRFQVGSDGDGVTVGGALVVSGSTTVNTFNVDVISEKTSAAGVTIDGVLLKDNGVVTGAGTVSAPVYSTTGDLNTGIFFPAADTIALAEGGAEAMRINSSGNVGIGTTSPQGKLDVSDGDAATTAGELVVDTANRTVYVGRLSTSGGTGSSFIVRGRVGTEIIKVDANAATFTTNAGLTFPATQVASAGANTLDDYEEGTFTPSIIGSVTAGVTTYSGGRSGNYTKIGNTVYYTGEVSWSGMTGTGTLTLSGLPFTGNSAGSNNFYVASQLALTANNYGSLLQINQNNSSATFYQSVVGGGALSSVPVDAGGATIWFGGFYFV